MELLNVSSFSFIEEKEDFEIQLKNLVAKEQIFSQEENSRIIKLIQEGNIETVAQILTHRRAVACVRKQG